jgi:hypothetical protein
MSFDKLPEETHVLQMQVSELDRSNCTLNSHKYTDTHTHTRTYTQIHTRIHAYTTNMYPYTHTHTHTHTHTYTHVHTHTHIHTQVHAHIKQPQTRKDTSTCICTYLHPNDSKIKPGDWACSCGCLNFKRRTTCFKCELKKGAPKPPEKPVGVKEEITGTKEGDL